MKRLHQIAGWTFFVAFLLTGQYMRLRYNRLQGLDDAWRLLFRSRHIYLLLIALINLGVGTYFVPRATCRRRKLQNFGSVLLLLAGALALAAFARETAPFSLEGPLAAFSLFATLGGTMFHAVSGWREQNPNAETRTQ
jgi:hypothetical protein